MRYCSQLLSSTPTGLFTVISQGLTTLVQKCSVSLMDEGIRAAANASVDEGE